MKIKEIFNIYSGVSGLTEKYVYEHPPVSIDDSIFVYSGSINENTQFPSVSRKSIEKKKLFGIKNTFIVSRNGNAGQITIPKGEFTINDHAYVFEIKKEYESIINLHYMINKLPNLFISCISDSSGNATFNKTLALELIIDILDIDIQNKIAKDIIYINNYNIQITSLICKIEELNQYMLKIDGEEFKIKDLCYVSRGIVINDIQLYENKGNIPVYTSQTTNDGLFGFVSLNYFNSLSNGIGKPNTLTWTTDGSYAGTVFKRNSKFVYSNVCGMLEIKNNLLINIDYLKIILTNVAKSYVSSNANNQKLMKFTMENIKINVPEISIQEKIVEEYIKLNNIKMRLEHILLI